MKFNLLGMTNNYILTASICNSASANENYKNIIEGGVATQSSTVRSQNAGLALDSTPYSCSQTGDSTKETWTVNLTEKHAIMAITIDTGNQSLSSSMELYVGTSDSFSLCRYAPTQVSPVATIQCFTPIQGNQVSIRNTEFLKLCNVEVLVCKEGFFGLDCDHRCQCQGNAVCDPIDGSCQTGCQDGFHGEGCGVECQQGNFGEDCKYFCHCRGGEICDRVDGACNSNGCAYRWHGPNCQTAVPSLSAEKYRPMTVDVNLHSLTLQWDSWPGYVHDNMELLYRVQYRELINHGGIWLNTADLGSVDAGRQTYKVTALRQNTHYEFRILPILKVTPSEVIEGAPSPISRLVKTTCDNPEKPDITGVTSGEEEISQSAEVIITWRLMTRAESNCDDVANYEVWYREYAKKEWRKKSAANRDSMEVITGLQFSSQYDIMLVVFNNEILSSNSDIRVVRTPDAISVAPESGGSSLQAGIIAGVVLCLVLTVAIFVAILLYRKKKAKYAAVPVKDQDRVLAIRPTAMDKDPSHTEDSGVVEGSTDITPSSVGDAPQPLLGSSPHDKNSLPITPPPTPHLPVPISQLERYVMERRANDAKALKDEYKEIPEGFTLVHDMGKLPGNKHKNRFINIIPYDHSRVILDQIEEDPESDYINASYINGYNEPKVYIAAQGCNKWTIQDMWRMLWQENSYRIIMVTNLIENGKRKCEQYWPDKLDEEKLYGEIGVTLRNVEPTADFVIRTFDCCKGSEQRAVKQFHFTAWPDHGVPQRAGPIISFRRKVRSYDTTHPGLMLVHCSAGVGRTGTFIALDILLQMAEMECQVDLYNITRAMRADRVNMIQTVEQYMFVYDALIEALKAGKTAIPCSDFRAQYRYLCTLDDATDRTKLEQQFETLATMSPRQQEDEYASGKSSENEDKNRFEHIIASDRHRPYLMTRVVGTNDYINAVFLDGYKSKNEYIVTQMPLPHTVIDFWRMVFEHNCGSIIMLNPWDTNDESYGQYWPEEGEACDCGPFVIELLSVDRSNPDITVRELCLQYQPQSPSSITGKSEDGGPRTVNQFQLNFWPRDSYTPTSKTAIFTLNSMVEKSQYKTGNGPVLVHCHTGLEASGLWVAVNCIWEKMKVDQEVDIFHCIKQLRYHLPQAVQDMEQYDFCYQMVLAYLDEFDTYANFH